MSTINDGGSAFPVPADAFVDTGSNRGFATSFGLGPQSGMSLRDHFAGVALRSLLSGDTKFRPSESPIGASLAAWSYAIADAMLAERAKVLP